MATKNLDKASTEEKTFKATAKQFIKYDGKFIKIEEEFQVKESDVKELSNYAEIEIPKEVTPPPANPGEGQGGQEPGGDGGQ